MRGLGARLQKLEGPECGHQTIPLIVYLIAEGGHGEVISTRIGFAQLPETGLPIIRRTDCESDAHFLRRVYRRRAETWPWSKDIDEYRETVCASQSESAALEYYNEGSLSEATLAKTSNGTSKS